MTIYFNTPERIALLDAAALKWYGTPFRENSAVCGAGGGVSCHFLTAELFFETGALERFVVPLGSARKLIHGAADAMVKFIDENLSHRFAIVAADQPTLPGDFITMHERDRRIAIHSGVVKSGGQFVHVLKHDGVLFSMVADSTYVIESIRRPLA